MVEPSNTFWGDAIIQYLWHDDSSTPSTTTTCTCSASCTQRRARVVMELAVAQPAGGRTIGRGNWKWTAARVSAVPAFKKGRSPRLWSVSHTQYSLLRCWSVLTLQLEKRTWRLDVFSSFALPRARIIDKELACFKQEERLSCPIHTMVPQNLDKPANSAVSLLRILWESSETSLHILCESSMGPCESLVDHR